MYERNVKKRQNCLIVSTNHITKQYYHYIMDNDVNYFLSNELQE